MGNPLKCEKNNNICSRELESLFNKAEFIDWAHGEPDNHI